MNPRKPVLKYVQIRIRNTTANKEDTSAEGVIKRSDDAAQVWAEWNDMQRERGSEERGMTRSAE